MFCVSLSCSQPATNSRNSYSWTYQMIDHLQSTTALGNRSSVTPSGVWRFTAPQWPSASHSATSCPISSVPSHENINRSAMWCKAAIRCRVKHPKGSTSTSAESPARHHISLPSQELSTSMQSCWWMGYPTPIMVDHISFCYPHHASFINWMNKCKPL